MKASGYLLAGLFFSHSAIAQYTITALPGCDVVIASVGGITDKGAITWSCYSISNTISELFLLNRAGYAQVGHPEVGFLHLNGINRREDIIGTVQNGRDIRGLVWRDGVAQQLPSPPDGWTVPSGINDRGDIVGGTITAAGDERGFLYRDGVMHDLDAFGRFAHDINNRGQVVLEFELAFGLGSGIYDCGVFRPIPVFGRVTVARLINDSGDLAGDYVAGGGTDRHAFYYSSGVFVSLRPPGELHSFATSINKHGHVVGFAYINNAGNRGFLYKDGILFDLQDLLPPDSGWSYTVGAHINDSGHIVGTGLFNNQPRIFLLSPARGN